MKFKAVVGKDTSASYMIIKEGKCLTLTLVLKDLIRHRQNL